MIIRKSHHFSEPHSTMGDIGLIQGKQYLAPAGKISTALPSLPSSFSKSPKNIFLSSNFPTGMFTHVRVQVCEF